jgi:glutamine amidotransferase
MPDANDPRTGEPGTPLAAGTRRRIAVLDYGAANMVSITKALAAVGAEVSVADAPEALEDVDALVVPGVGAAQFAMDRLRDNRLLEPLMDWVRADRPCLGICLGFQILFESSDEGGARTLGLLPGRCRELEEAPTLPHIGWNSVEYARPNPLFESVPDGSYFYFVHSYAPAPTDPSLVLAWTTHGRPFASAAARGNLFGVQFHPEKSSDAGLRVLSNFVGLVDAARSEAR